MRKLEAWEYPCSRRSFFKSVGYGGGGLALAVLAMQRSANAQTADRSIAAQGGRGGFTAAGIQGGNAQGLQLPFWGDGALWDHPQYYETIQARRRQINKTYQSSDIDGDGQDELIARSAAGILANRFDAASGQWIQMTEGPSWSDAEAWNNPIYYSTIQCADIDGDGRDELIARSSGGIVAYRYDPVAQTWNELPTGPPLGDSAGMNRPQYYETIQCADIDGDGAAELLARNFYAIIAYKYDPIAQVWNQLPDGPAWGDDEGWHNPQYYSTIQCADIDGDGRAELIGRGYGGITAYNYDPNAQVWNALPVNPLWGDPNGWNLPRFYSTIQFADIDGDGAAELVSRNSLSVLVSKYDPVAQVWNELPDGPAFSDANSWGLPQFYTTIQCADIDGDGTDELLARSSYGIIAFKYDPKAKIWSQLPAGPELSDPNGWNQVQYYSTIQTATINNPDGTGKIAALVGRSGGCIQTWNYDPAAQQWNIPSAAFTQFTGDQLTAYNFLTTYWNIQPPGIGVRARYNDESGVIAQWLDDLQNNRVPPPPNVAEADWQAVYRQIQNELLWVGYVQNWYGNLLNDLIKAAFLGDDLTVQTVGDYMRLPNNDNSSVVLSALGLLFGAAGAIAGGIEGAAVIAAVAGLLSTAASAGAQFMPGGGDIDTAYANLQEQLNNSFNAAITGNNANQFAITGGADNNGNFVPGDYGLLNAIGSMIDSTVWIWPSDTSDVIPTLQASYALSLWRALIPLKWHIGLASTYGPNGDYPKQYLYVTGADSDDQFWLSTSKVNKSGYPATASMSALFDAPSDGQVFPLGVPLYDVFEGTNGWPTLFRYDFDGLAAAPPVPPRLRGAGIRLFAVTMERDPVTNEVIARIMLHNRGMRQATNLELTQVKLQRVRPITAGESAKALYGPPHTRIAPGEMGTILVRFSSANVPGTALRLYVQGRYRGGGFTLTRPVVIP